MSKVISIGQFRNGSFGAFDAKKKSDAVIEYFAVEGDKNLHGFPNFASPHRAAVEGHAREIGARGTLPCGGKSDYMRRIISRIGDAILSAARDGDSKEERRLRELASKLEAWKSHLPLPHEAHRFA